MKVSRFVIAFALLAALFVDGFAVTRGMPPKDGIPADTPSDVKKLIEGLYSSNAVERGKSAALLGVGGPRSARAVPFLIALLGDDTVLKWIGSSLYEGRMPYPGIPTSPGEEAEKALARIGRLSVEPLIQALKDLTPNGRARAAGALQIISGKNLGEDPAAWQGWWEEDQNEKERRNIRIEYP